jgi:predicted NACHT family NTPase
MSQIYNWKRFWCTRAAQINLGDRGYLVDPESEYGHLLNPELVSLESIADMPCLVLLGEPGIGKSQEMANLFKYTVEKIEPSHPPLELNLRSCNSLAIDLVQNRDFIDWNNGEHKLYLFLDSLDEGLLTVGNLATQLVDEFNKNKYRDKLDRLYIRVACRTAVLPQILEQGFRKLWEENLAIYELAPLRYVDVENAARAENIDSQNFLSEVWDKTLVPLAIKPLTLGFLLNIYKRNGDRFPPDRTLCNFYLEGCRLLCEENNLSRQSANQIGILEADERLIIAARIAAITVFANRFAIWTGTDRGEVPAEDVLLRQLILGNEFSNGRAVEVTESTIREVIGTPLFSSRGSNRMGWAHQTYAEFLAAWYLVQHQIPLTQIKELIFSAEDPDRKLIPQLHETAAWLANISDDVLQEIIKTDPDVLLRSDVSTDANIRSAILDRLLTLYEQEKLFDRNLDNYHHYAKLNYPGLADRLHPYIHDTTKQFDVRDLAINIAEVCKCSELREELVNVVLNSSEPISLRASAARAISSIGDEQFKLKLKPLAIEQIATDEDDQLKGYALKAVWPCHLTAEELFFSISPPKQGNFIGSYHIFTDYELVQKLQANDLLIALKWLERQGVRGIGHPFDGLGDAILIKAWENFELQGILESFTRIVLVQWREYQSITTHGSKIEQQFKSSFLKDIEKRHQLIEQAVSIISQKPEDAHYLLNHSTNNVLTSDDIFWMLDRIQKSDSEQEQKVWARLIKRTFQAPELMPEEAKVILDIAQINSTLYDEFLCWMKTIDLDSVDAVEIRASYLQGQSWQSQERERNALLDPSPDKRVINRLDSFESGNLQAWLDLNLEMTLLPISRIYNDICRQADITYLPGWENADVYTRSRIVKAAEVFIQNWRSVSSGINLTEIDVAGYKALRLLLSEDYDRLSSIPTEVWQQFARIMPLVYVYTSDSRYVEPHHLLMKEVYARVPDECVKILIPLIDRDNKQHGDVHLLNAFQVCWDDKLLSVLSAKLTDRSLKAKSLGKLLEQLLKHDLITAKNFAKSLILLPLPSDEDEHEKVMIAARLLIKNSDSQSWQFIWSLIQQDSAFGREIIEYSGSHYLYDTQFKLNETQLADLYLWLVHQYPYNEDSCHNNETGFQPVSSREGIGRMRDSVLSQLREKGTLQACTEIQRLSQQLPEITWLGKTLIYAQANMRRKTWQSPKPEQILQLVFDREKRLVQSGEQLLDVLIESLDRLTLELQGETSAVRDIWDKNVNSNSFRPIDENAFSDYIKRFLDRDLKSRGIVANREVELRRGSGGNPGERTDIHVDAVVKLPTGETYDCITVIIEAKGCWHPELQTAMESQLVNRYLADNTCKYGLYLIGWFSCPQWDSQDRRNQRTPQMNIDEAKIQFNRQAEMLSTSGNVVRAYVMNTALR